MGHNWLIYKTVNSIISTGYINKELTCIRVGEVTPLSAKMFTSFEHKPNSLKERNSNVFLSTVGFWK